MAHASQSYLSTTATLHVLVAHVLFRESKEQLTDVSRHKNGTEYARMNVTPCVCLPRILRFCTPPVM